MNSNERSASQLIDLAIHLNQRRSAILTEWRSMAKSDPHLDTASSLSRSQLNDHIPDILDSFEKHLTRQRAAESPQDSSDRHHLGSGHGLHRWQQGYQLREVVREWRHLHVCLFDELAEYESSHPDLAPGVMETANRALIILCTDGVCESASQYAGLQEAEAASRVRDLQRAIDQLNSLHRFRAEALREAAHDLRGNVGVVKNISAVLNNTAATEEMRVLSATILENSVESLHAMLEDLMSLARLEAGHEQREFNSFDTAEMLRKLCGTLQSSARTRNLFLKVDGPVSLEVVGDMVKTRRIIQNLVLNALNYTRDGGVVVTWNSDDSTGKERWYVCVQDTGPGFLSGSLTPFARVLKKATEEAHHVEMKSRRDPQSTNEAGRTGQADPAPTLPTLSPGNPSSPPPGEGIGLLIVKRLCDLLDASLELETEIGRGTTIRVSFPRTVNRESAS